MASTRFSNPPTRPTSSKHSSKSDPIARDEMPVQPAGEVERRELEDAQDKTQKPVMPPHTAATVAPSGYFDREEVAQLAYSYWLEREGRADGNAEEDWLRAEQELRRKNGQ